MAEYFVFFAAVVALAIVIAVGTWLSRGRCPSCGKFAAARVTGSTVTASVVTEEWGYDQQREEHRHIPRRHTGHLITRQCRFCHHSWDRLESSSRQLDRLSEQEAERYRERNNLL